MNFIHPHFVNKNKYNSLKYKYTITLQAHSVFIRTAKDSCVKLMQFTFPIHIASSI